MGRRKKILVDSPYPEDKEEVGDIRDFDLAKFEGIGPIKKKRLEEAGVKTPFDIVIMGSQEISQVTEMKKEEAVALVDKVRLQLEEQKLIPKIESAADLIEWHKKIFKVSTGSEPFDIILRGGISSQALTEVYGPDGAGKTQLLNTLTSNALNSKQAVLLIDCEGTTDTERILEVATERGLSIDLEKLFYYRANDTDTLEKIIKGLVYRVVLSDIKLILIDGAIGLYRSEYDRGRAELNVRQNDIKPVLRHLRNIADYLNVAVVLTNQVMGNPDGGYGGDPIKPIGGFVVAHHVKYIIKINKGSGTKRSARLVKSPFDPIADVVFYLNKEGISDYEDLKKKKPAESIIPDTLKEELINVSDVPPSV